MKLHWIAAASLALASGMLAAPQADATLAVRGGVQMAAGPCQPFITIGKVRYSASGISNVGTKQSYVVCSDGEDGGASEITIMVTNNSSTPQTVSCTARPGYGYGSVNRQIHKLHSATIAFGP